MYDINMGIRMKISIASNIFVAVMTAVAFVMMTFGWGSENSLFSLSGVQNLKFFTVLSNLFSGVVSAVFAAMLIGRRGVAPYALYVLKLAATVAVAVTFFTVVILFMVIFGLGGMFYGANFWFHLVLPLVSIIEFCLLDTGVRLRLSATFAGLVPVVLYGIAYFANILINGVGEWPNTNDWYGFLSFGGLESAPIVSVMMLVATWLIALVIWAINRVTGSQSRRHQSNKLG